MKTRQEKKNSVRMQQSQTWKLFNKDGKKMKEVKPKKQSFEGRKNRIQNAEPVMSPITQPWEENGKNLSQPENRKWGKRGLNL
jgi:hypothetical protein